MLDLSKLARQMQGISDHLSKEAEFAQASSGDCSEPDDDSQSQINRR